MKISFLLPDLRGGGAERVNLDLAYEFDRQGYTVEFILQNARGELLKEADLSFSIIDLKCSRTRQLPWKLSGHLSNSSTDVIISSMWPLTIIAPIIAFLTNKKIRILISEHAILSNSPRFSSRIHKAILFLSTSVAYRFADHLIAVSRGVADDMSKISKIPRSKIEVIYNPLRSFNIQRSKHLLENPPTKLSDKVIIGIGSLTKVKNYALLIEAFSLMSKFQNIKLFILGEGPCRKSLEKLIREKGMTENVFLPGFIDHLEPWFTRADLFVHSSNSEGFGNVLIEALSFGVPIVSTDCPTGPREILQDGKFGSLVPMNDPVALSEAILEMLRSPTEESILLNRASNFEIGKVGEKYISLLD